MRVSKHNVFFIANEFQTRGTCILYTELNEKGVFSEFAMDGVNPNTPEIYLKMDVATILSAAKVWKMPRKEFKNHAFKPGSKFCVIRLTRKDDNRAYIMLEITSPADGGGPDREVTVEVPVKILTRKAWDDYVQPSHEESRIYCTLPSAKTFRTVCHKMKQMDDYVQFKGKSTGSLALEMSKSVFSVSSKLRKLTNHKPVPEDELGNPIHFQAKCTVNIALLYHILCSYLHEHSIVRMFIYDDPIPKLGLIMSHHDIVIVAVFPHVMNG